MEPIYWSTLFLSIGGILISLEQFDLARKRKEGGYIYISCLMLFLVSFFINLTALST